MGILATIEEFFHFELFQQMYASYLYHVQGKNILYLWLQPKASNGLQP